MSSPANTIRTQALVLRRTNYGEADRILQLITPEHGKLGAMAKGARKNGSKLAGGIELFCLIELTLHRGRGDLYVVTSSRLVTFFARIIGDYERLQTGYRYLREISRATEMAGGDGEAEWFDLALEALRCLDDLSVSLALAEVWFRLRVAHLLGQGLNTETDTDGEPLGAEGRYHFDVSEMSFAASSTGMYGADEIKFLRVALYNSPLVLKKIAISGDMMQRLEQIARALPEA